MASQEVISLVVDKIVEAFDGDVDLFESWLTRSRLETELAQLESAERILRAEQAADVVAFNADLTANLDAQAAKKAEIDAL